MRRLAAVTACLAALALVAGCSVDLEGAACSTPGDRTACPEGQACGTGHTCSKRAASCTPCVAEATTCKEGEPAHVYTCSAEGDPACGTLAQGDDCGAAKVCGVTGTGAACRCARFTVDPAGAAGVACSYTAISAAISAAQALQATEVLLGGITGQTYGDTAADRDGITLPDGMTLRGADATPSPADRPVLASGGGEGIRLGAGSALRGLSLRRASGGPAVGIRVTGASPTGGASLDTVVVEAGGAGVGFATGVQVEGNGLVTLRSSSAYGATVAGLEVVRADGAQEVAVSGGLLQGNAIGVKLERGTLSLNGTQIFASTGPGIQAAPATGDVAKLTARSVTVARGANVGLLLQGLAALELTQVQVCANSGRSQTILGVTRTAGGVLALGAVTATPVIRASQFFSNTGDQVVIGGGGSTSPWSLSSTDCSSTGEGAPNVLAGYVSPGVGITVITATADVTKISWGSEDIPRQNSDYVLGGTGAVPGSDNSCQAAVPAPACPAAP